MRDTSTLAVHLHLEILRQDSDDFTPFGLGLRRYLARWGPGDDLPFNILWDQALVDAVLAAEQVDPQVERLHALGDYLRSCLEPAGWLEREKAMAAALRAGQTVALHIATKCEGLHGLPWELIRLDTTSRRLYETDGLHLRFEVPQRATGLRGAGEPLWTGEARPRVLLAWSDAGGAVPHEPQLAAIRAAWGTNNVDVLPQATLDGLESALAAARAEGRPVEILQLLAHGGLEAGSRALWLGRRCTPADLVDAVAPVADSLSAVVLCACSGAKSVGVASRMGTPALALHEGTLGGARVATVVACRTWMAPVASETLTKVLHQALAAGQRVDAAVAMARRCLRMQGCRLEASGLQVFGAPVPEELGDKAPAPRPDEADLREKLDAAQRERRVLRRAGQPIPEALSQGILDLRRRLRAGPSLRPGEELGGRYELQESLGKGHFAEVWKAFDQDMEVHVAVKVLHGQHAKDQSRRERFFHGAEQMRALRTRHDCPNIVEVLEVHGEDDGYHWFAMEYLRGGDLHRAVEAGQIDADDLLRVVLPIGDALERAHKSGRVHRDVKPQNILLDADGRPKLTDFDLVKVEDSTYGTRTHAAMGSVKYAAPELLGDAQGADARADLYGLAMTAVFVLRGSDLPGIVLRRPEQVVAQLGCSESVKQVLLRALEFEREARFDSVATFCAALEAATRAPEEATSPPTPVPQRRQRGTPPPRIEPVPEPDSERPPQLSPITAPPTGGLTAKRYIALRNTEHPLNFVGLTGGEFTMGSPRGEEGRYDREGPQHRMRVPPLFVATTPITQAQWRFVALSEPGRARGLRPEPSHFKGASRPVEQVNWADALRFAAALSELEGRRAFYEILTKPSGDKPGGLRFVSAEGFRLPSEAEWEFFARGGTTSRYWSGDTEADLAAVGWFAGNSGGETHPVGEPPSARGHEHPWGLYDVHGNVWEWCLDPRAGSYAGREGGASFHPERLRWEDLAGSPADLAADPAGRVIRGGSWGSAALVARSAYRHGLWPWNLWRGLGFRLVLVAPPEP